MLVDKQGSRRAAVASAIVGAAGLMALALPAASAHAQSVPYLGVDFGNGWGVGIGAPPSAYGMRAESPLDPFFAPRYYYRPY